MIYDRLLKVTKYLPQQINKFIKEARLFHLPKYPREFLSPELISEIDQVNKEFFLPFRTIAIEDKISVIIIHDQNKNAVGLKSPRLFVECSDLNHIPTDEMAYREDELELLQKYKDQIAALPANSCLISVGIVHEAEIVNDNGAIKWMVDGNINMLCAVCPDGYLMEPMIDPEVGPKALVNIKTAYEELIYFNSPDRFILECKGCNKKVKGKNKHGSSNKPRYIIVNPSEARRIMRLPNPSSNGKKIKERRAHWRCAHTRILTHPRFVNARGKEIKIDRTFIPALWVGPTESVVGKNHYRILINR